MCPWGPGIWRLSRLPLFVLIWMSDTAFQIIKFMSVVGLKLLNMMIYHCLENCTLRRRLSPSHLIHFRRVLHRFSLLALRRDKDWSRILLRTSSDDRDRHRVECGPFWSCWYLFRLQHPLVLSRLSIACDVVSTCISVL